MMKQTFLAAAMFAAAPAFAAAQGIEVPRSMQFPGSLSMSMTSGEPAEPGNVASSTMVTQGVTVLQHKSLFVVGFADLTVRTDSEGYAWNNTVPYRAGAKLVLVDRHGVLEAAAGVMSDARDSAAGAHRMGYVSYWRGWRGNALSGPIARAFPGSGWVSSGYVTAHEPRNWITSAAIEQSATMYSLHKIGIGPFARLTATTDTQGQPWNNRSRVDAGAKVSRRISTGIIEGGVGRRYSVRKGEASTTVAFVNLWMGWTPRAIFE